MRIKDLSIVDAQRPLTTIHPPFNFNAPDVANHAPEITGYYLLQCLRRRLGWSDFADKKLLEVGCGVRFVRTIYNLDIPFGLYAGVDVNLDAICWLKTHVRDARFWFAHLNARNAFYNPEGQQLGKMALADLGTPSCDAVSMFSVITHQNPKEAMLTFRQVREVVCRGTPLYFTAFADGPIAGGYRERDTERVGMMSDYDPNALLELLRQTGSKRFFQDKNDPPPVFDPVD